MFFINRVIFIIYLAVSYSFLVLNGAIKAQGIEFLDHSDALGVHHTFGASTSGGVSFVDFDGDGWDDLSFATAQGLQPSFFINRQTHFEELDFGLDHVFETKSILWADIDNDGDKDLFLSAWNGVNRLYEQTDYLQFKEITLSGNLPLELSRSYGCVWGDYNRDGYLDLLCTFRSIPGTNSKNKNRLFQNLKNNTFVEVTDSIMCADEGRLPFCNAFFDYNRDQWPDIYIANDRDSRNTLLTFDGVTYTDYSIESGAGVEMDGMNVAVADVDNDGLDDIYITNIAEGNVLLHCERMDTTYQFINEAKQRNVEFFAASWGANFADFNNDGWQDIYVSGAEIGKDTASSAVYVNNGNGYFTDWINYIPGDTVKSYANAIGDWNNDGRVDIAVNNSGGFPSKLYTNFTDNGKYFKLKLEGVVSNRQAVGCRIEVWADSLYQNIFTFCGNAFLGQNSDNMTIGIADYDSVDSCKVTWPSGHIDRFENIMAGNHYFFIEGESTKGEINIDPDLEKDTSVVISVKEQNEPFPFTLLGKNLRFMDVCDDVSIYNSVGSCVFSGTEVNEIDMSYFPACVYFGVVNYRGKLQTFRFFLPE